MNRNLLGVALVLATGVAIAEDTSKAKREPAATQAPAPKDQARKDAAQKAPDQKDPAQKDEAQKDPAQKESDAKQLDGMSILGNQETPKALVIVPWKSSEIGASIGISPLLDDSRQPIDKDVFMRALSYYEIRSETTRHEGAQPAGRNIPAAESGAAQSTTKSHRRKS